MLLIGILLVSGVAALFIESPAYRRGRFDGAFWRLSLEDQLALIHAQRRHWRWLSGWSMVSIAAVTGGLTALAARLGVEAPTLAFAGLGVYVVAMSAWVLGLALSFAAMSRAASVRHETESTPSWLAPLGDAAFMAEITWIIGANVAYVTIGAAVLATGLLPDWAGWSAIGLGGGLALLVAVTRTGFPQMADLVPFVLGVAAILEAV